MMCSLTLGADFIPAVLADCAVLSAFALLAVFEFPYFNLFCSCYLSCQCLLDPGHTSHGCNRLCSSSWAAGCDMQLQPRLTRGMAMKLIASSTLC